MIDRFHNYNVLYNYLKSFEQRADGWELSHQPIEPFSFPKEENDLLKTIPYDNKQSQCLLPNLSKLVSKRKSTLTESFSSSLKRAELLAILSTSIGNNGNIRRLNEYYNKHVIHLRNYPSGGAMYAVKIYLYIQNVDGCAEGLYLADHEGLKLIREEKSFAIVKDLFPILFTDEVKVSIFFIADFKYTYPKYGHFSLNLALLEAGHICQNLQLATTELDKGSLPVGGFYSDRIEEFLEISYDPYKHCIYTFLIG